MDYQTGNWVFKRAGWTGHVPQTCFGQTVPFGKGTPFGVRRGRAYLAGLAVGYWKDKEEIRKNWKVSRAFECGMEEDQRRRLVKGWKRAIKCALCWAEEE